MHHFIVIGNPISHSKSPLIHHEFARQLGLHVHYERQFCPNDEQSFGAVVEAFFKGGGMGANVTLPFKEVAWQLCQDEGELSNLAHMAGAVNTLAIKNGKLYGDNTDGRGLVADLLSKNINLKGATVAMLGAGGATRGAILPLLDAGANIAIFNRTPDRAIKLVSDFDAPSNQTLSAHALADLGGEFDLIINATSAGTNNQSLTLPPNLSTGHAYDMMYGKETEFLAHFRGKSICHDGMGMLIHQALLAFELWTGADVSQVDLKAVATLITPQS